MICVAAYLRAQHTCVCVCALVWGVVYIYKMMLYACGYREREMFLAPGEVFFCWTILCALFVYISLFGFIVCVW